jgi:hypothetical protein
MGELSKFNKSQADWFMDLAYDGLEETLRKNNITLEELSNKSGLTVDEIKEMIKNASKCVPPGSHIRRTINALDSIYKERLKTEVMAWVNSN